MRHLCPGPWGSLALAPGGTCQVNVCGVPAAVTLPIGISAAEPICTVLTLGDIANDGLPAHNSIMTLRASVGSVHAFFLYALTTTGLSAPTSAWSGPEVGPVS